MAGNDFELLFVQGILNWTFICLRRFSITRQLLDFVMRLGFDPQRAVTVCIPVVVYYFSGLVGCIDGCVMIHVFKISILALNASQIQLQFGEFHFMCTGFL